MASVSIVIPTYNRHETLAKALHAYMKQSAPESIRELIVVDDGSNDGTESVVLESARSCPFPIHHLRQSNQGPAAARNAGIKESSGQIILFTDDDIIPDTDLVAEHMSWHEKHPGDENAVLGYVTWAPDIRLTPFMRWYGFEVLFAYSTIVAQTEVDCSYFYSCNLSLKAAFVRRNGNFDEEFKTAAFEDIELGLRLKAAGLRLLYNAHAIGYHEQNISFRDACARHQNALAAVQVFKRKEAGRRYCEINEVKGRFSYAPFKRLLRPAFAPFKAVMDYQIPLPWGVYRTMFRIYR